MNLASPCKVHIGRGGAIIAHFALYTGIDVKWISLRVDSCKLIWNIDSCLYCKTRSIIVRFHMGIQFSTQSEVYPTPRARAISLCLQCKILLTSRQKLVQSTTLCTDKPNCSCRKIWRGGRIIKKYAINLQVVTVPRCSWKNQVPFKALFVNVQTTRRFFLLQYLT